LGIKGKCMEVYKYLEFHQKSAVSGLRFAVPEL